MVAIKDKEVSRLDVERVMETAKAVNILNDQQVLHVLNQEFIIDGQEDVREPIGMSGIRLEVRVHIVTGAVSAAQNIMKCVRRCGLEVRDLVLQPLASAMAVLSEDEKDLGVCLVDIGGGTTDIAVFTHGAIRHTAVIPIAGDQITNDIAMALRTPTKDAEDIKCRYGCALRGMADPHEMVEVAGVGDRGTRQLSRQTLAEVIEPRVEELYSLVQAELRRSGFEELLSSGIVITGGSSSLQGMVELGEEIFPYACTARPSALSRQPGRSGAYAAMLYRHWLDTGRHGTAPATPAHPFAGQLVQANSGKDEKLVSSQFLRASYPKTPKMGEVSFWQRRGGWQQRSKAERLK